MKTYSDKAKRQYVLEKAIISEIGTIRHLFTEARHRWEPEEADPVPALSFDQFLSELDTLKTKIVGRLDNLLKSVTLTYEREDD